VALPAIKGLQDEALAGVSVHILREMQELSQSELSRLTGIPQSTISANENDRVNLGVERSKVLATTLRCSSARDAWQNRDDNCRKRHLRP
jgi:transcriptional regulator with XRE-family HTH domain